MKSERTAERIDDQVQLRALLALGPIIAYAPAAPTSSTLQRGRREARRIGRGDARRMVGRQGRAPLALSLPASGLEAQLPVSQPSVLAMIKG